MRGKTRLYTLICIILCCMLAAAGCKSDNNSRRQSAQGEEGELLEQDILPPDVEPYRLLDDYYTKKFDALGKLVEVMDASPKATDEIYSQLFYDATFQVMECGSGLDRTLMCMAVLQQREQNDWQLQYDRYTGYMDLVDGLYKFEFYIAEEEQPTEEPTGQPEPTPTPAGQILPQDPLATAKEITMPPTVIPERLDGYIEGTLPEGSNRMAVNVYAGRLEEGTRALTLWFEIMRDEQGGYWTQSYYAWDNVGVQFNTVREHVYGGVINYAVLTDSSRPGSIFSLQTDEDIFFADAAKVMKFNGSHATYYENGEVSAEF